MMVMMCLMSDDLNVFKIHVMMTFVDTARKFSEHKKAVRPTLKSKVSRLKVLLVTQC